MEFTTHHFDRPGPKNTADTLRIAREWTESSGIGIILVATCSGKTGVQAVERWPGNEVIVVTHSTGFREDNEQELRVEYREAIEKLGGRILTCQHALAGISRAVRFKFNTLEIDEIVAGTLRVLGQGMKVCAEICLMAADAGLVRTDRDVVAIGGTGRGADTAAVIRPANVSRFFDLKIRAILCKPWDF